MANGQQISRYPVMGGPQLSSVISRQRMYMDDAMYARDKQKERQLSLAETGGKGFVEYDKMLRGFVEAKYANPKLTFWDYASKPSVGAAFRKQGREMIADELIKGGEVEGLGFGARQKAGLKGIFGKDKPVEAVPPVKKVAPPKAVDAVPKVVDVPDVKAVDDPEYLDPSKLLDKSGEVHTTSEKSLATIAKITEEPDAVASLLKTDPSVIERSAKGVDITGGEYSKVPDIIKPKVEVGAEAVLSEPAKGGLKSALGKGAKGIGYGYSLASGISNISKGQTTEARAGGALQAAGGAAGLVAMTNFWNPVGWAAALPAALSLAGAGLSKKDKKTKWISAVDALKRTPIGRYRRRVGIGV